MMQVSLANDVRLVCSVTTLNLVHTVSIRSRAESSIKLCHYIVLAGVSMAGPVWVDRLRPGLAENDRNIQRFQGRHASAQHCNCVLHFLQAKG